MSGVAARTWARSSSASALRPTTRWPASSRSAEMPSRRRASSSATTTRSASALGSSRSLGVPSAGVMSDSGNRDGPGANPDLERIQHEVARILAETESPVEVYAAVLETIGIELGWELGAVWEADSGGAHLRCVTTWRAGVDGAEFEALSEELVLRPGEGLPGRVFSLDEPLWVADAPTD